MFPIYQSRHIRVDLERHIATLTFAFSPLEQQGWDGNALEEWERAIAWLYTSCPVGILVIRSGTKDSFCRGLHPLVLRELRRPADRAAFAWRGQQLIQKLAHWPGVSIASIDGLCRGVGWELALACDYRLAVQRAATRIELPQGLTCFGGSVLLQSRHSPQARHRLASGIPLSAREAFQLQLVDHLSYPSDGDNALSRLREQFGHSLAKRPLPAAWLGLASERRRFAAWNPPLPPNVISDLAADGAPLPFPHVIGVWGDVPAIEDWLLEALLKGALVLVHSPQQRYRQRLDQLEQRGFCTSQEKLLLLERLRPVDHPDDLAAAELIVLAPQYHPGELCRRLDPASLLVWVQPAGHAPLPPISQAYNTIVRPQRVVRLSFLHSRHVAVVPEEAVDELSVQRLVSWFQQGDYGVVVFPADARILASAA
ncbi:MAG: enoyl-CoA hydratase/isomerase family protein [Thermogemmata sp.]